MSSFDWENFLKRWSQEIMESIGSDRESLPPEVLESGWLGYPGATEEQLARAETRLGKALPPSYRAFLKVTNGWRQTTPFISRLWSTEEIDWFTTRHQNWLDMLVEKSGYFPQTSSESSSPLPSISDEDYFVYGDEQDCSKIRVEYLQTALEISQRGEASIYLLNPQIITEAGEWEAWFLGNWLPGADRYRSFQEMMQAEYESFLELRETPVAPILSIATEKFNNLSIATDTRSRLAVVTPLQTEALTVTPSEKLPGKAFIEDNTHPVLQTSNEWEKVASFTIEIQSRKKTKKLLEQRTIVRHLEAETVAIYPNIDPETIQQYISDQLTATPIQPPEKSVGLEITQLRVIHSLYLKTEMVVDQVHPLFPAPIEMDEPFTLEVSLSVTGLDVGKVGGQQLSYHVQCFAHNLSTQIKSCLGDVVTQTSMTNQSTHTVRFPEITLHQPGIYRLTVWVTLQNMSASPALFRVPMLQVV